MTTANNYVISRLLPDRDELAGMFRQMELAEEEISKAQARHGETGMGGPLWRSFLLLQPQHSNTRMRSETLYRSHCHELLERVVKGADTRPATDAEIIAFLAECSLAVPLTSSAACLYFRLADRSIPELARVTEPAIDLAAYEKVHGNQADQHEDHLRKKLQSEKRKS